MLNKNSAYFLLAPNPDHRVHDLLVLSSRSPDDLQKKAVAAGVDIDRTRVILGEQLAIVKHTLIKITEPIKRRGRPPGTKNKRRSKKIDAKVPGNQRRKIVAKSKKSGRKTAVSPGSRDRVPAARGRHSGETQAERNARVETAS